MDSQRPAILDCHQHFFEARRFRYPVFEMRSGAFEALVGDYSTLPRLYLPDDYARDTEGLNVVQTMWAEFISDDPGGEVQWANELADATGRPNGTLRLRSLQWNASSASAGPFPKYDRGFQRQSRSSVPPAACSRVTCQYAHWPAASSNCMTPTLRSSRTSASSRSVSSCTIQPRMYIESQ